MAFQNPYSAKLHEFPELAFGDADCFSRKGKWREHFTARMSAQPRRLVFEVGCSNAEFLCTLAARNADIAFLGLDWKFKVLYKGAKRAAAGGLRNVALLRQPAEKLGAMVGPGELGEVWIFFPDPWAKKSQLKHRLMQEPFLLDCHRALAEGGRVFFKTDHPGYFQWVLALFGEPVPELAGYEGAADAPIHAKGYQARQVRVRRTEEELPRASEALRGAFRVESVRLDYWGAAEVEPGSAEASGPKRPETLFSEEPTLFEKQFRKERLPIYYLELAKR